MAEEIEEIMDDDDTPKRFSISIFRKKAAKFLFDYFYGAMSSAACRCLDKETVSFVIDIENNSLNHETCACAALFRKTPEWHQMVHNIGWAFGETVSSYNDPDTFIGRYKLHNLMDVVNDIHYNRSLVIDYETLCGPSGMTALVRDLYDIFTDSVSDTGHIYEVMLREHSAYGGGISIVWKK